MAHSFLSGASFRKREKSFAEGDNQAQDGEEHAMSVWDAALALVSTCIGGGFVGFPFAFYHTGIPFASIMMVIVMILTIQSCKVYLAAKDMTPGALE